jgi:hypothetical protein
MFESLQLLLENVCDAESAGDFGRSTGHTNRALRDLSKNQQQRHGPGAGSSSKDENQSGEGVGPGTKELPPGHRWWFLSCVVPSGLAGSVNPARSARLMRLRRKEKKKGGEKKSPGQIESFSNSKRTKTEEKWKILPNAHQAFLRSSKRQTSVRVKIMRVEAVEKLVVKKCWLNLSRMVCRKLSSIVSWKCQS